MSVLVDEIYPGMKIKSDGSVPCLEGWIEQIVMKEISSGRPYILCDRGIHYLDDPKQPHGPELHGLVEAE